MQAKHTGKRLFAIVMSLVLLFPAAQAVQANEEPSVVTPAAELRANLDHLLSEHFVLAAMSMMMAYDDAEAADTVNQALEQNAQDMTPAIASIYGGGKRCRF